MHHAQRCDRGWPFLFTDFGHGGSVPSLIALIDLVDLIDLITIGSPVCDALEI